MTLHINKKYLRDYLPVCLFFLALAIICGVSYKQGQRSVESEAVINGHMVLKDGEKRWTPTRYFKVVKNE